MKYALKRRKGRFTVYQLYGKPFKLNNTASDVALEEYIRIEFTTREKNKNKCFLDEHKTKEGIQRYLLSLKMLSIKAIGKMQFFKWKSQNEYHIY